MPSAVPGGCVPVCFPSLHKLDRPKENSSQTNPPAVAEAEEGEDKGEVTGSYARVAPCGLSQQAAISS